MEASVPRHVLRGISFNSYNSSEILELSVKEITNPQTFDGLLHPTLGGLYDPKLGPTEKDDKCQTCGMGQGACPGHLGHITLPLPTYNPFFFSVLYQLLKGTCFDCHRLAVHSLKSAVLVQKFRLLEHGLISSVADVDEFATHFTSEYGNDAEEKILEQLNEIVLSKINNTIEQDFHIKNVEACKNNTRRAFIHEHFTVKGKCVHCRTKRMPLRKVQNAKIMLSTVTSSRTKKSTKPKQVKEKKDNDADDDEEDDDGEGEEEDDLESGTQIYLTSADVRDHLRQVWQKDQQVLKCLFHFLSESSADYPTDSFFIDVVPVPPSRFRPVSSLRDKKFENPQTQTLCNVLKGAALIRKILSLKATQENGKEITEIEPTAITEIPGKTLNEKLQNALVKLQVVMNCIVDGDSDKLAVDKITGVKQILEKKEGLFRKNMMGKRVNFAARSVISPDPCISTCEIGIPEVFAKKLTFPQPVTPWNVHELRQAVINGPDTYPGASLIDMPDGSKVILNKKEKVQREAIAKQLLTPSPDPHQQNTCKVVHRHLKNGDVLLINRQPTLHRPSIQAHKARVLPGEKTLRLHYANCKAYNADFDGDEMNAHFPQTQLGRAEAYTIACTDYQYLVPKDGTPLAGLIQDHMVSGVSLTIRGRFFTRNDYCQLVYMALVDKRGPINLLPPALIKPKTLWSGKQVLSTLLHNIIPKGGQMLNLTGKSKIPEKSWIHQQVRLASLDNMGESHVVIRGSELLCGVLDKGHYGNTPYGLVHCCYELYGGEVAGTLLSCLGRLFMNFLQQHRSFSLGVEDILVTQKADQRRKKAIHKSGKCGDEVVTQALGLEEGTEGQELREAMMDAQFDRNDRRLRELDLCMKGKTDDTQNAIVGACMPKGLEKLFPANNLQLMVQSGAKGSSVNCMQISGLLGQIELEGRRPPLMLSGKTLPSFLAYDSSPRAGGFVAGRFLTGIRPQEYFFHCMAGREGLIDTAVKTSRSGYLQRCLIKHLEGIIVNYDMTVRDSDGSIVQFYYGEDGLDISKTGFLSPKQFPFLTDNSETGSKGNAFDKKVAKRMKKIKKWNKSNKRRSKRCSAFLEFSKEFAEEHDLDNRTLEKTGRSKGATETIRSWQELEEAQKERYIKHDVNAPDPVTGVFRPFQYKGVLPESFLQKIQDFSKTELNKLPTSISEKGFLKLLCDKAESSYCQPGEAVGLLCAQSIGEPSTQMTLNTFHFAGRGEMNVTLGIPRLVEILMVASDKIKTPSMEVPILAHCQDKAKKLQMKFNKVILSEVLEKVTVNEFLSVSNVSKSQRSRNFKLRFHFLKPKFYTDRLDVTPSSILHFMEKTYIKNLLTKIKKKITDFQLAKMVNSGHIRPVLVTHTRPAADEDDADEDLSDIEENDNTASDVKARQKKQEEQEYEEKEEEKEVLEEEENVEMDDNNAEEDEEDKDSEEDDTLTSSVDRETSEHRIQFVVLSSSNIADYKYDIKRELWCEFTLQFGLLNSKIDLTSLIEEHAKETVVHCVPGINRCLLKEVKSQQGPELHICTEGINILEIFLYADILDLNRLYSNDIHAIANMYGIEAANKVIIKEIKNVFAAYGIEVDYRHLSLLADYMTFEGTYKAFNRRAIETCASCLQQMSFETTMSFLVKASLQGAYDNLKSPSSQIVAGKPISCGSGAFELLYKLF